MTCTAADFIKWATVFHLTGGGGGGSGNVTGPVGATDNALVRFDGASGLLIQNSKVIVQDDGSSVNNSTSYSTGTIAQSGMAITLTGGTFTSAMDGGWLIPASGSPCRVFFVNATTLTGTLSQTISAGTTYTLSYFPTQSLVNTDQPATIEEWITPSFVAIGNSSGVLSNRSFFMGQQGFAIGTIDETLITSGAFASQSGISITGSGTADLSPAQIGKMIIYSTGQSAIYSGDGVVSKSQTVPLTSFVIVGESDDKYVVADNQGNLSAKAITVKGNLGFLFYNSPTDKFSAMGFQNTIDGFKLYNYDLADIADIITIGTNVNSSLGEIVFNYGNLTLNSAVISTPSYVHAANPFASTSSTAYFLAEVANTSGADVYSGWKISGGNQFTLGIDNSDEDKLKITNGANPSSGDTLYYTDVNGNHYFTAGGNFNGIFDVHNSFAHFQFYLAGGPTYNEDLSLTASQSGNSVFGTGTAFNSLMSGGFIRWPSTGNIAKIRAIISPTQMTVGTSATQADEPFIIYFPGYNYDYSTNIFTAKNLETLSIDTIYPNLVLDLGQVNARLIRAGRPESTVYAGEIFCTGQPYNSNLALSASQSGSTVTGSGTTFDNSMVFARIIWPSTGNTAKILEVLSATSLTVDDSFIQPNAPFYIYYGGINIQPSDISIAPTVPFYVNQIDTDSTYKVLQIGLTNADYMLVNCGIGYLPNYQNTSPYTCVIRDNTVLYSFASGGTINLYPTPYPGMSVDVKDILGNGGVNPTTVNGNGNTIQGAATFLINSAYGGARFFYTGIEWCVF